MKWNRAALIVLVLAGLVSARQTSHAFALLGPVAPWMQASNGVVLPGDIGGPMELGSEYRWNVPVVTYGFDQSFLDFFGTNGVKAVEDAIQILNDLPAASDLDINSFPLEALALNQEAQAQGLYDLKSASLRAILEQMGMVSPTRSMFVLNKSGLALSLFWDDFFHGFIEMGMGWAASTNNPLYDYLFFRNYDPQTLLPSNMVNGTGWFFYFNQYPDKTFVVNYSLDPLANIHLAVSGDSPLGAGSFFTGLTRDDVGGLKYLLSATNINFESRWKMAGVGAVLRKKTGAWRPGVEQVSFIPHPNNPITKRFKRTHFVYTDSFYVGNLLKAHKVGRSISRPDILFCAADNRAADGSFGLLVDRTGTTNWVNNADLNANTNGEGPGVIVPPIKITFHKLGDEVITTKYSYAPDEYVATIYSHAWGSFNDATNFPVAYPDSKYTNQGLFSIHLHAYADNSAQVLITNQTWNLLIPIGGVASLQISTNKFDWTGLVMVTNAGVSLDWYHYNGDATQSFRAVAE